MTYTLTAAQLADLQDDLGVGSAQAVFTDAQLNRLFDRAGGVYNTTVVYALRQLTMNAAKLHSYTAGNTSASRGQVFDHLQAMLKKWEGIAGIYGGGAQLSAGGLLLGLDADDSDLLGEDG